MTLLRRRSLLNQGEAIEYFLDKYPASLAWSDRQLAKITSGGLVVRLSDNRSTPLIYGNDLKPNQSFFDSYALGGRLVIENFNDQSGNGYTGETRFTNRAQLYGISGAIEKIGSEPILNFTSNSVAYNNASFVGGIKMSVAVVVSFANPSASGVGNVIFDSYDSGTINLMYDRTDNAVVAVNAGGGQSLGGSLSSNIKYVLMACKTSSNTADVYQNGVKIMSSIPWPNTFNGISVGTDRNGNSAIDGSIGSVIVWSSDQTSNVADITNELKTLYNIP